MEQIVQKLNAKLVDVGVYKVVYEEMFILFSKTNFQTRLQMPDGEISVAVKKGKAFVFIKVSESLLMSSSISFEEYLKTNVLPQFLHSSKNRK